MCCDHEWRVCGFADMDVWRSSDLPDPIKPTVIRVVLSQQLTCYHSTIPSHTRYVSHQQPHLWMLYGAPHFSRRCSLPYAHQRWATLPVESTGKVLSRFGSMTLTGVLIVGGLGYDVWQLVPSLGCQGITGRSALASDSSDGLCSGIALQFRTGSKQCDDVDLVAPRCYRCQCCWQTMEWVDSVHEVLGCFSRSILGSSGWGEN